MNQPISYLILFVFLCVSSCSSQKDIFYLQKSNIDKTYNLEYKEYTIKVDDILKIDIKTNDPETTLLFEDKNAYNLNSNKESILYNGYQVDVNGNIHFNEIGKIKVVDLTINQARDKLYDRITKMGILLNPLLDIKIINSHFTILGEVNMPGRYDFLQNNLNIFEAIGMAGDLTITGKRSNVMLIREIDAKKVIKEIDLTKTNLLESENFQIISNDIIIVNPNRTKINSAGVIGSSSTLITLLSFILSSIILITNN